MLTTEYSETIDACRFCFMCRHICTLGVTSGKESDTPRGKGLLLSKVLKGYTQYSDDLIETIYRCCQCGLCRTWCQADSDLPGAVLAARADIIAQGKEPQRVRQIRDSILTVGNPFGLPSEQRFQAIDAADADLGRAEVLYYVGCDVAYRRPEIANAFLNILRAAGVKFHLLSNEHSTGKPLRLLGYRDDARSTAQSLIDKILATGCTTVVTTCPSSFDAMARDYSTMGLTMSGVEILHSTSYLDRLAAENRISFRAVGAVRATYLDDGYLGRQHRLFNEPRRLLQRVPQLTMQEMTWSCALAYSCGEAGGVFHLLYPDLGGKLARRVLDEAARAKVNVLATSCPVTKDILTKENRDAMQVRDVVELLIPT